MALPKKQVPRHLRRYVVEQDYSAYNIVDQAVWRFVLLQTHARLRDTAHSAYRQGLTQSGISVEHIPRIQEMDECLARFGWGAVAVDGFIPPRAFQEFQACGILPIAADIRSKEHLVYTPAPDIIHEAAGHAPILIDAVYSEYLRRLGAIGSKAFASPEDARVYAAIFELSEVKETPGATPAQTRAAERALAQALAGVTRVSEASRLSRLYWWTAEYGLIGRPNDFKLYGAGLLSSLWESYSCHDPGVTKIPISLDCIDVAYDITRPQPQLFVARDFEQLFELLDQVDATLAYRRGGEEALLEAERAQEVATIELEGGAFVVGVLETHSSPGAIDLLRFKGPLGLGSASGDFDRVGFGTEDFSYRLPVGVLVDGVSPCALTAGALRARAGTGSKTELRFASGVVLEGRLAAHRLAPDGNVTFARFTDYRLSREGSHGFVEVGAEYVWLPAERVVTARAGAADARYFPDLEPTPTRVPRPRHFDERALALEGLYEEAVGAFRSQVGGAAVRTFEAIHETLQRHYTDEWLLRWNLLECLYKLGAPGGLARSLTAELSSLELRFSHREPIASGLRYLSALAS